MNPDLRSSAPVTSPPILAIRRKFYDFDEFADVILDWGLDWRQLDRGPLRASLQQAGTPSLQLSRFRFSRKFHQRCTTPPGMRTFGITGERSPHVEWRGREGTSDHIVVFPAADQFDAVSHPGFHGDTVSVSEDRIRAVAGTLGLPDPLESVPKGQAFVASDPRRVAAFRRRLTGFHATVTTRGDALSDEAARSDVEFDILSALVEALVTSHEISPRSPEPPLRTRALRLTLDYIEDHADQPPTIEDICRASGASWRTLDYAFRERFGVTPKQYLQATRLQQVRGELYRSAPDTSVSEIAARWGFWHMGQFAADYRRQFGELPSETLRRTRAG